MPPNSLYIGRGQAVFLLQPEGSPDHAHTTCLVNLNWDSCLRQDCQSAKHCRKHQILGTILLVPLNKPATSTVSQAAKLSKALSLCAGKLWCLRGFLVTSPNKAIYLYLTYFSKLLQALQLWCQTMLTTAGLESPCRIFKKLMLASSQQKARVLQNTPHHMLVTLPMNQDVFAGFWV